jgi:hypothetical protein
VSARERRRPWFWTPREEARQLLANIDSEVSSEFARRIGVYEPGTGEAWAFGYGGPAWREFIERLRSAAGWK